MKPNRLKRAIERNPNTCPHCGSLAIECGQLIEYICQEITREVSCEDCGEEWQEKFGLVSALSH